VIYGQSAINLPGLNTVQVRGYDLQTTNLSFATTDATSINGTFSVVNSNITFVPAGWFGPTDSPRIDPANTTTSWDVIYARYSDGPNASPYAAIRVIALFADSYSEGLPDSWRNRYFGSPAPAAGRHPNDDFDGDGFSNFQEWLLGSNPADASSNLRITNFSATNIQWQAKGYEVYEIVTSTNFTNWTLARSPVVPTNFVPGTDIFNLTNSVGKAGSFTSAGPKQFFRVRRVP